MKSLKGKRLLLLGTAELTQYAKLSWLPQLKKFRRNFLRLRINVTTPHSMFLTYTLIIFFVISPQNNHTLHDSKRMYRTPRHFYFSNTKILSLTFALLIFTISPLYGFPAASTP